MIKDKLTLAIAETARAVMTKESWPDAASTSIYVNKAGDAPISDTEAGSERKMTDENIDSAGDRDDTGAYKGGSKQQGKVDEGSEIEITADDITEALKKNQPASEWIHDFVNSKDAKFKGKSKAERINMALGAYYAAQREVKEGVEEPRAQGEKNFKAAHTIDKKHDVNQDDQTGTESMTKDAKPNLPVGNVIKTTEDVDGEKIDDEDVKKIKSSAPRATAPKATGSTQSGAQSAEKLTDTTKGGSQNATAPKASGSTQSGAQSAEKIKNTAPSGKLSAEEPKPKQKGSEPMPKGLKESAINILLGEDAIVSEGILDTAAAMGKVVPSTTATAEAEKPAAPAVTAPSVPQSNTLAQKSAQAKLAKMSTSTLQNYLTRITAVLKARGVTEDVSFNEAFDLLGEELIKECMSNFDKQYADDHAKELKQILAGQGTDGIDSKLLPQLNKFITAYGDELKKHLDLPIVDGEKKDVKEATASDDKADIKESHGSPADRGAADAYYGRAKNPHYYNKDSQRILGKDMTPQEIEQYNKAYDSTEDRKEYDESTDSGNEVTNALENLESSIKRCQGLVPQRKDFKNSSILKKIQNINASVDDVCVELDGIQG